MHSFKVWMYYCSLFDFGLKGVVPWDATHEYTVLHCKLLTLTPCGLKCKGTKVKQSCWNPCWNPLLEPLSALEPSAGTLLEPPFGAGNPAGTPAGTHLSALEPLLEPTFVRFW